MIRSTLFLIVIANALSTGLVGASGAASGSGEWTIVESYPVPEGASGLAFDGTDLYFGIYGVNGSNIYRFDLETGTYSLLFVGPQEDAFGLSYDGEHLWTTDHPGSSSSPARAMKLDWNGDILDQFDMPDHYMSGIACDGDEFWVTRYYPDPCHLYRLDGTGIILDEFDGPDDQPWDLAMHDGNIWIADYWGDTLYLVGAADGSTITSHATEGVDPAGVVWDGQFLWYCDNGDNFTEDRLYKVSLQGGGTPQILVPVTVHDFGNVPTGETATWNVAISNTGTDDLVISGVSFAGSGDLACSSILPVTLASGAGTTLAIEYGPQGIGPLDAMATIESNDPINPGVELDLQGYGVLPAPEIFVSETSHNYGAVRVGAHTRWYIEITNFGDEDLVVNSVSSSASAFFIEPGIEFPVVLSTLGSMQVGAWFHPTDTSLSIGLLEIVSNDPQDGIVEVTVSGSGVDFDWPIGTTLWSYLVQESEWDNSFKALHPIEDVSGDGRADVIGCTEDNFIRCYNGNASGTGDVLWQHSIYSGNIYSGKGLDVVEDIDGDGFQDVVVGATGGARLIRMLSGRTGEERWTYHTDVVGEGGWVYQVDGSRDFNGDGIIDVLACAGDDGDDAGPRRVYCLDGLDGASLWQAPLGGTPFAVIAVDDFNGDTIPDAVAGASNAMETDGRAVGIDGATGSITWSFDTNGSSVWGVVQVGDISGDGINDVVIGDFISGEYHGLDATDGSQEYLGTGLGLLTGFQRLDDVDGDGQPDFVPEHFDNDVRVISGADGGTIWSTPVADNPTVIAPLPDISGDGINDLVVGTLFSDNYTYFLDGVDGSILQSANFGTPVDSITAIPDVVGDGSWELVAGGRDGTISCISGGLDALVFNPADINEDGYVNVDDLLLVIGQWGMLNSPADISGDGIVGVDDLLMVIAAWGHGP